MLIQENIGMGFLFLFLLINLVLLLNFVIALLGGTFSNYEDKQLGLYYEVIVAMFPVMEYDDRYGSIVCAQTPFNLFIMPFQPLVLFPIPEKYLIIYNTFLCHLIYFPIGFIQLIMFTFANCIFVPLAYFGHVLALIQTVTDSDETMDELEEKIERVKTILKFIVIGPLLLVGSVFLDAYKYWINLYTQPSDSEEEVDLNLISKESIELFQVTC